MILKLKYGTGMLQTDFRPPRQFAELKARRIATLQKPEEIVVQALERPIGCFPFNQIFRNAGNVLIVVPDDLQNSGGEHYLPLIIKRLQDLGVPAREISILVAKAWGARQNGVASFLRLEKEPWDRPRVFYHDPSDTKTLEYVGETRRGTPVFVNRLLVDADNVILCGVASHHPFAGYGGGPGLVVPECAGGETIARNLALTFDPVQLKLHPRCAAGVIEGNPLHEDTREAFRFITVNFLLHTILNENQKVVSAVGGEPLQAYAAACHIVNDIFRVPIAHLADLVIVSAGGSPHDRNYLTAHRALHHAAQAVRLQGALILVAECRDGIGARHFMRWFEKSATGATRKAAGRDDAEGLLALSTAQKAQHLRVIAVTGLAPEAVRKFGFVPADSINEALRLAHGWLGELGSCYVLPNGSTTVPYLQ